MMETLKMTMDVVMIVHLKYVEMESFKEMKHVMIIIHSTMIVVQVNVFPTSVEMECLTLEFNNVMMQIIITEMIAWILVFQQPVVMDLLGIKV
jgi:hypothetical protein